jgi:hypothetical protein
MKLIDDTVPLDSALPAFSTNTSFRVIERLNLADTDPGVDETSWRPLRIVASDDAPARVVRRRS